MNRNVTATILIVLAVGIYLTFTRTKLAEVNAVREVNLQYSTAIKNANRLISSRDEVQKKYNLISDEERTSLDKMLPNSVDNIRLVIDLDELANSKRLVLRNIRAVAAPEQKKAVAPVSSSGSAASRINTIPTPVLDTVTVSFSLTASYDQMIDFLRALETNLRIMDVTKLSVLVNPKGGYDFSVELKTYWLRTP